MNTETKLQSALITGKVDCKSIGNSRAIHSFVEKRIRKWAQACKVNSRIRFHVTLERQGQGHIVGCHVTLSAGSELWTGTFYARGLHSALTHCLTRMTHSLVAV